MKVVSVVSLSLPALVLEFLIGGTDSPVCVFGCCIWNKHTNKTNMTCMYTNGHVNMHIAVERIICWPDDLMTEEWLLKSQLHRLLNMMASLTHVADSSCGNWSILVPLFQSDFGRMNLSQSGYVLPCLTSSSSSSRWIATCFDQGQWGSGGFHIDNFSESHPTAFFNTHLDVCHWCCLNCSSL